MTPQPSALLIYALSSQFQSMRIINYMSTQAQLRWKDKRPTLR